MKKGILAITLLIVASAFTIVNNTWKSDKDHSQLVFTVTHLGISDVSGTFNDFDVTVQSSKADFSDAVFEMKAKVNSIDTRVEARDNHLKSADFFDADKFPEMTFKSKKITKNKKDNYKLTGDLTMHGVTKSVTMDMDYRGKTTNPMNNQETIGFQVSGKIKRSDFNIGPSFPELVISEEVHIKFDGEFIK